MKNWSVEVLPPRNKNRLISFINLTEQLIEMNPDYISVTYGSNHQDGVLGAHILKFLEKDQYTEPLQHITYINKQITEIDNLLNQCIQNGTSDILALRGDGEDLGETFFQSTAEFVRYIKQKYPNVKVSVACYPEGNNAAPNIDPIENLLSKQKAGADFAICQITYDSASVISFIKNCTAKGVNLEIIPGICPSYNKNRFEIIERNIGVPGPVELSQDNDTNYNEMILEFWSNYIEKCLNAGIESFHFYSFNEIQPIKDLLAKGFINV
jgi:methylenetetrahydrofolate reductase (NADPH)